jgi:hypothetical protein
MKLKKETVKVFKVRTGIRAGSVDAGTTNNSGGGRPTATTIYRASDE